MLSYLRLKKERFLHKRLRSMTFMVIRFYFGVVTYIDDRTVTKDGKESLS